VRQRVRVTAFPGEGEEKGFQSWGLELKSLFWTQCGRYPASYSEYRGPFPIPSPFLFLFLAFCLSIPFSCIFFFLLQNT
jgi:hypothetical protein